MPSTSTAHGTGVIKIGEDTPFSRRYSEPLIPKRDGTIFSPKLFAHGEVLLKHGLYRSSSICTPVISVLKGGVATVV